MSRTASSSALRRAALDRDASTCCNCGAPADHAHHVIPLARGGRDVLSNLVSLCAPCHGAVHGLDLAHHRELTRAGLAAAKARGVKLGGIRPNTITENKAAKDKAIANAEQLRPVLAPMAAAGCSLRRMSEALAAAGKTTRNGKPLSPSTVKLQLQRLGLALEVPA